MENRVQLVSVEVSDIGEKHFFVTVYTPARGVFYTRASSDEGGVMKRFRLFGGCTFETNGAAVPDGSRVAVDRSGDNQGTGGGAVIDSLLLFVQVAHRRLRAGSSTLVRGPRRGTPSRGRALAAGP